MMKYSYTNRYLGMTLYERHKLMIENNILSVSTNILMNPNDSETLKITMIDIIDSIRKSSPNLFLNMDLGPFIAAVIVINKIDDPDNELKAKSSKFLQIWAPYQLNKNMLSCE